jgi:ABC-type bacteriocin/lantibiotic exporter with double-glycine peptidase domain
MIQVARLLSTKEKLHLSGILVLILIGMILEMMSVSLIIPLVALVTRDDFSFSGVAWVPDALNFDDKKTALSAVLGLFVLMYLLKSVFAVWSSWIQKSFSARLGVRFGDQLFSVYVCQPYEYYLKTSSASLIRKSQNSGVLVSGVIDPILTLLSDGSVAIALATLLLIVEPIGTVVVLLVLISASFFFQKLTKNRLQIWGAQRNHLAEEQLKILQHSLGGIRDVILADRSSFFRNYYLNRIQKSALIGRLYSTVLILPRIWLELVTVFSLFVAVVAMSFQGREISEIGVALTLYAGVAFRTMPSVNRMISSVQAMLFSRNLSEEILEDLGLSRSSPNQSDGAFKFTKGVTLEDVSFRYKPEQDWVFKNVNITFDKGKSIGIIGLSGVGKSTLLDLLLGLLKPSMGRVLIDGRDISELGSAWRMHVGYVPQDIFLMDDTMRSNVAFGIESEKIDESGLERAIRQAKLDSFVETLPAGLQTVVGERGVRISGGQRQRLGIARALYSDPEVLFFDEATSSLDQETEQELMIEIADLGRTRTTFQISHRLATVRECNEIYRIESGTITLLSEYERAKLINTASGS